MEMRLKSTASRSDNDITDEAAGRARVEMAMQSMQRRQAHKEALARSNSDMRQRLSQVKAKTDVDVTDEEAGRFRVEYAAAAQRRRAEEAARRRAENAALRERLKAVQSRTDDGDAPGGYGSPRPGSPPLEPIERPSDVQHTTYLRLREIEANMGRATQLKQQKAELKERARQEELAWKERGRQRFEERVARDREIKAARKHCKLTNQVRPGEATTPLPDPLPRILPCLCLSARGCGSAASRSAHLSLRACASPCPLAHARPLSLHVCACAMRARRRLAGTFASRRSTGRACASPSRGATRKR